MKDLQPIICHTRLTGLKECGPRNIVSINL